MFKLSQVFLVSCTLLLITLPVSASNSLPQVTAGDSFTVLKMAGGILWSWGDNSNGQLGRRLVDDDISYTSNPPRQLTLSSSWAQIASGVEHTLAIDNLGRLWAWGVNSSGQFGNGTLIGSQEPVQVDTETNWSQISAGSEHTVAIKTDGTLWASGGNSSGQLGDGTAGYYAGKNVFVQIGAENNWQKVSAGRYHTFAIKNDGSLWAWGNNYFGVLGDGTKVNKSSPVMIGGSNSWMQIATNSGHAVAIKTDGTLWSWGRNNSGQLGDGTTVEKLTPTQVGTGTSWVQVSVGGDFTAAIKADGSLWTWGLNSDGQLGLGYMSKILVPTQVAEPNNWASVTAGTYHTVAITTDGLLWAWGKNDGGQVGYIYKSNRNLPELILDASLSVPEYDADGNYELSWFAFGSPGETYVLEESTFSDFSANVNTVYTGSGASVTLTGRSFDTIYYYRIKTDSGTWKKAITPCAVAVPCSAPTNINVPTYVTSSSHTISWGASSTPGVTYVLEESTDSYFTQNVRTSYTGTSTSTSVVNRESSFTYYYRVKATHPTKPDSPWQVAEWGCLVELRCATPSDVSLPRYAIDGECNLCWVGGGCCGIIYVVEEALDESFSIGRKKVYVGTETSLTLPANPDGEPRYYRVKATREGYADSYWKNTTNGCLIKTPVYVSLGDALDKPGLIWTTGGDANWKGQIDFSHDGVDSAQSGTITHNQSTSLETTVVGPGKLAFQWNVFSEGSYDLLTFFVNNKKTYPTTGNSISGSGDWREYLPTSYSSLTYYLKPGPQTLKWVYSKDESVDGGTDQGWVDQVYWQSMPESDLDDDQDSDVLWVDSSNKSTSTWLMQDGLLSSKRWLGLGWAGYNLFATGDLNADADADLVWYNPSDGNVKSWLMRNGKISSKIWLNTGWPDYSLKSLADIDGDGDEDAVWFNSLDGGTKAWLIDDGKVVVKKWLGYTWSGYTLGGMGDIDGDGDDDFLWVEPNSNAMKAWKMPNGSRMWVGSGPAGCKVAGLADFDGDGDDDILWRDLSARRVYVQEMQRGLPEALHWVAYSEPGFELQMIGDVDADSTYDLIWTNPANGNTKAWMMSDCRVGQVTWLGFNK